MIYLKPQPKTCHIQDTAEMMVLMLYLHVTAFLCVFPHHTDCLMLDFMKHMPYRALTDLFMATVEYFSHNEAANSASRKINTG